MPPDPLTALPRGVALTDDPMAGFTVDISTANARVLRQGAQVVEWTPQGADPVIWLAKVNTFEPGDEVFGGVPICFPWFSLGPEGEHSLVHGWARFVDWTLVGADSDEDAVRLRFRLDATAHLDRPEAERLADALVEYHVTVGSQLRLELIVEAGPVPVEVEASLHTYLAVDSIHTTRVTGLEGVPYWDKARDQRAVQKGPIKGAVGLDRVYDTVTTEDRPEAGTVEVVTEQRTITVTSSGSTKTVVWTPHGKGAVMLGEDSDQMLCVETVCARDQPIIVAPGQRHVMAATYAVK